jgi:hypothetical protein
MQNYQDDLIPLYPKNTPLQRCLYNTPYAPITALVLDDFAVRSRKGGLAGMKLVQYSEVRNGKRPA